MKALKIIGNIIIGFILFGLIFSLSIIKSTQNFIEKDLIIGLVKASITETVSKEADRIKDNQKELINEIFNDEETKDFVGLVINSFVDFQNDKTNFSISDSDVEKIYSYAMKHKSQVITLYGNKISDMTDKEFKELFSSENVNRFANKIFEEISSDLGENLDKIISIYDKVTSSKVTVILIILIVFFIIVLGLINWSVYKWMLVPGICLIISGLILVLIYGAGSILNDIISEQKILKESIGGINFVNYIIVGGIEFIVGIILIVIYNIIDNRPLNEKIDSLANKE